MYILVDARGAAENIMQYLILKYLNSLQRTL